MVCTFVNMVSLCTGGLMFGWAYSVSKYGGLVHGWGLIFEGLIVEVYGMFKMKTSFKSSF